MLTPLRANCSVDTDLLPAHQIEDPTIQKVNMCSVYLIDRECGVANLGMGKHSTCHQQHLLSAMERLEVLQAECDLWQDAPE
jgi:hypothetical protein